MIYKIAWPLAAMLLLGCAGHPPQRPAHPASARDWAGPVVVPSSGGAIIAGSPASAPEGAEIMVSDKLSLAAALALTVQHNPTLAAFAAEIEARDGAARQSGLPVNPSLDLEVENFAGRGERQGMDGAETTLALSQLIEPGGKRHQRQQLTLLEKDLAGWDYQSKKLDLLTATAQAFIQVRVRPADLLRYHLTIGEVVEKIKANNGNAGAQFLVKNAEEYIVRSVGLAEKISDLERIVLKVEDGTPVYLDQVAQVVIGGEIRRGLATMNGQGEVVVGMVLKLIGTNTSTVIADVKSRLTAINQVLPQGVHVVPYYDQAKLVQACVKTVTQALIWGVVLVAGVLLVFMGGLRASLVVAFSIPFSIFFAFILMHIFGISANLMSLGGLAIAIGMMVDATIVMVENVDRLLRQADGHDSRLSVIARACAEVARPIIFAVAIIIIVFLPLFTLQGVEGKTFSPLAYTVVFAMLGSLLYALLLAPVASHLLMRRPKTAAAAAREPYVVRWLMLLYGPLVRLFVRRRLLALGLALVMLAAGLLILPRLGSEFVPRLDEGELLIRATLAPSISLEEARETMLRFEKRLMATFPEVSQVVTRVGRGEIGAHADPVNSAESFVGLKPQEQWPSAQSAEQLYTRISEAFKDFPGAQFNVTLLIILLLLFMNFNSLKNTLLIMLNIPLALVGGVAGLWLTGQNLSVPSSVGFIALFGIALENGMVLVSYLNQLLRDGEDVDEASVKGASLRLRPVLMTAFTTALGLIPLLFSTGTGSEVQRPLATVVVGGLVTSTILTLLVIPALYKWFSIKVEKEIVP